jgi:hypothetical protein
MTDIDGKQYEVGLIVMEEIPGAVTLLEWGNDTRGKKASRALSPTSPVCSRDWAHRFVVLIYSFVTLPSSLTLIRTHSLAACSDSPP